MKGGFYLKNSLFLDFETKGTGLICLKKDIEKARNRDDKKERRKMRQLGPVLTVL